VFISTLVWSSEEAFGSTYLEALLCRKDCYLMYGDQPVLFEFCLRSCQEEYDKQHPEKSVGVRPSSSGYHTGYPYPYLMVEGLEYVSVDFDILTSDSLDRIDLYLVNHNNPPDGVGVLVGSDDDGGDGWRVTFDPDIGGADKWVGYLVAEAHFPAHPIDPNNPGGPGDVTSIYITRKPFAPLEPIPTVSEWGLIIMAGVVLTAGAIVIVRRRRRAAA